MIILREDGRHALALYCGWGRSLTLSDRAWARSRDPMALARGESLRRLHPCQPQVWVPAASAGTTALVWRKGEFSPLSLTPLSPRDRGRRRPRAAAIR